MRRRRALRLLRIIEMQSRTSSFLSRLSSANFADPVSLLSHGEGRWRITGTVLRRISPSCRQYVFQRPSFADELPLGIRIEVGQRMIDQSRKHCAVDIELRKTGRHAD